METEKSLPYAQEDATGVSIETDKNQSVSVYHMPFCIFSFLVTSCFLFPTSTGRYILRATECIASNITRTNPFLLKDDEMGWIYIYI